MGSKRIKKTKLLWQGIFNFNRELHILYGYAYTERQAWLEFCYRLADKHGVRPQNVMNLFDGTKDNYEIKEEKRSETDSSKCND